MSEQEIICKPYHWQLEESDDNLLINIWALREDNSDVRVIVRGFTPYVYIELPFANKIKWTRAKSLRIVDFIERRMQADKPVKMAFVKKKKLYFASKKENKEGELEDKLYPFLFLSFRTAKAIRTLQGILRNPVVIAGIGRYKYNVHEQSADPILKYTTMQKISPGGWIKALGNVLTDEEKESNCSVEVACHWKKVTGLLDKKEVINPMVLSVDIECFSSRFPAMPKAEIREDCVFMISAVAARQGSPESSWKEYLLFLIPEGEEKEILNMKKMGKAEVLFFKKEKKLLEGFAKLVRKINPEIILGYNILDFDFKYMIKRSEKKLCWFGFSLLGKISGRRAEIKERKWESKAYGVQHFLYLEIQGRLLIDMYPVIKRDYKLESYKLGFVSDHFLGATKDPVEPEDIYFSFKNKSSKQLSRVAKYCVKDSILPLKLMENLQTWIALTEMSVVASVPIFYLYTKGQQIKVFSQVYKEAMYRNYVVINNPIKPVISWVRVGLSGSYNSKKFEKNGKLLYGDGAPKKDLGEKGYMYIDKLSGDVYYKNDDSHYVGATCFTPKQGFHTGVVTLDFASLYPTIVIAYNICFTTAVPPDSDIPDEMCHVMEWEDHVGCIVGDSQVSLENLSVRLDQMKEFVGNKVYSHNENEGLKLSKHKKFLDQGIKECVKLTFQDGTNLTCTPDHPILTTNKGWVEAKDLIIGEDSIQAGFSPPLYNPEHEFNEAKGWSLQVGETIKYNIQTMLDFEKSIRFVRILGWLITDGHVSQNRVCVFLGHMLDVKNIQRDIKYICGIKPNYRRHNSCWEINLPSIMSKDIKHMEGIVVGAKVTQPQTLPSFILDEKCPLPIVREFLAGLFGGDGHAPSYSKSAGCVSSVRFSKCSVPEHLNNLQEMMLNISKLLLRFGIKSSISKPLKEKNTKKPLFSLTLNILIEDLLIFYNKIGFRYCVHKNQRLSMIASYHKYKQNVFKQREWVVKRVRELKNGNALQKATEMANNELKQREPILNQYYSQPTVNMVIERLRPRAQGSKFSPKTPMFPSIMSYLKDIGVWHLFKSDKDVAYGVDQNKTTLDTYNLKVISRESVGEKHVYDLSIKKTHNFVANGIVVHNCPHDPNLHVYCKNCEEEVYSPSGKCCPQCRKHIRKKALTRKDIEKVLCCKRKYRWLKKPLGILPSLLKNLLDTRKQTKGVIKQVTKHYEAIKAGTEDYLPGENKQSLELRLTVLDKIQLAKKISANSMYGAMGALEGYLPLVGGAMCVTWKGRQSVQAAAEYSKKKYGAELVYGDSVVGDEPILCQLNNQIVFKTIEELGEGSWVEYHGDKECCKPIKGLKVWTENGFTKIKKVIRHVNQKDIFRVLTHTGVIDVTEDHSLLNENAEKVKPSELKVGYKLLHSDLPKSENSNKVEEKEAYIYGLFYADGSCGDYDCPSGPKCSWAINNADYILLEMAKFYMEEIEPDLSFKILETMGSSGVYKLVAKSNGVKGGIKIFVQKYRNLLYNHERYKKVPNIIINASKNIKQAFLDGYWAGDGCRKDKLTKGCMRFDNKGKIGSAGLYYIAHSLGYPVSINTRKDKPNVFRLTCTQHGKKQRKDPDKIKKLENLGKLDLYVYDLETENHHFQAGVGRLIAHNTDSVMLRFSDCKTIEECHIRGQALEKETMDLFPPPMLLEYENIYWYFLIMSKKRYAAYAVNQATMKLKEKMTTKGIVLARRDNTKMLCKIYKRVLDMIMAGKSFEEVMEEIDAYIDDLMAGRIEVKQFIISKSIGENYKAEWCQNIPDGSKEPCNVKFDKIKGVCPRCGASAKTLPPHVALADKLRARGKVIQPGDRLEYVFLDVGDLKANQAARAEDPKYFKKWDKVLNLDYLYYLEKQLIKPIDELLSVTYHKENVINEIYKQYKKDYARTKVVFDD